MVYLLRKNITTQRPSDKLDFKKLGPFKILEKISDTNYRLSLTPTMGIHPVFHILLLEKAPENAEETQDTIIVPPTEGEYVVERITDERKHNGQTQYKVKWKNYDESETTWEPIEHLQNARQKLQQYWKQRRKNPRNNQTSSNPQCRSPPRAERHPPPVVPQ